MNMVETSSIRVAVLEGHYASLEDHGVPVSVFAAATIGTTATAGSMDCQILPRWLFLFWQARIKLGRK